MMRSLYSGISGLKNHQTRMDIIGNNISNVNTIGYKASRTVFQDMYSQTLKAGSAADNNKGGTNPVQVGLGVKLSAIDIIHTSAPTQRTDNPLDLALDGDGFFVIEDPGSAGTNYYTRAGNFTLDSSGNLVTSDGYFVQGEQIANAVLETDGTTWTVTDAITNPPTIASVNLANFVGISVDFDGTVYGMLNGERHKVAQLSVAMFANSSGLEKAGSSMYRETGASGTPQLETALTNGAGRINGGGLEMSNVDLSTEFTDMIITQRGYQANSRVITVSDTMLEELVNLKR